MGNIKQINIKKRTCYLFNNMINIEDFVSNLQKIDKKSYKNIVIYYIGYITKKDDDCQHIYSVNLLYLNIDRVDGHIDEKNGIKYLVFDSTYENEEVLKNTRIFGMGLHIRQTQ